MTTTTTTLTPRHDMTREEKKALIEAWRKRDQENAQAHLMMVGIETKKPSIFDRIKGIFI
jgi:hypothetical protein